MSQGGAKGQSHSEPGTIGALGAIGTIGYPSTYTYTIKIVWVSYSGL
jgi:hypothetical protein